ncbi:Arc family DNA-binding protein [Rhizobium pusense]|uniref:Arc family DNA-binding protein n=1 Tax=Agrobacterium pusense TaxID=648995 RepID=UPI00244A25D5|nr:Arc family DNA-binding protein [Agrobacterium pusense]MDH2092315.1 Arc family DNA-binding protein [Agrobacterium pusense]
MRVNTKVVHLWGMAKDDPYFRLRIPEALKAQIEKSAGENNRSMTAEIISRLERSYEIDDSFQETIDTVNDMYTRLEKLEYKVSEHDELIYPGRYDRD